MNQCLDGSREPWPSRPSARFANLCRNYYNCTTGIDSTLSALAIPSESVCAARPANVHRSWRGSNQTSAERDRDDSSGTFSFGSAHHQFGTNFTRLLANIAEGDVPR